MSVPPTFTKEHFSASTNGRPIAVTATTTPGTTIHTDGGTVDTFSEVWLYATNVSAVDRLLTVELGAAGAGNEVKVSVPAEETIQVLAGHPMSGGDTVAAYSPTPSQLNLFGWVNHIDQT